MPPKGTPPEKRKNAKSTKPAKSPKPAKPAPLKSTKPTLKKTHATTDTDYYALYDRMAQIHYLLLAGDFPSYERVATESGYSVRTAKRDVSFMRDHLSRPIDFCRKRGGLYYTEPNVDFPFLKISEREIIAICLAYQVLEAIQGTIFAAPLHTAFHKTICQLSKKFRYSSEQIAAAFSFTPFAYEPFGDPEVLAVFSQAILAQEEVEFSYARFREKEASPRRVHPLHLRHHSKGWTLFSYDPSRGTLRNFVLSRARNPRATGQVFEKTAAHDWQSIMAHSIGTYASGPVERVRLRLSPEAHQLLTENPAHPTQEITELPDGTVELTMTVTINPESITSVRGWGSEVRVLEPQCLNDKIVESARQIIAWAEEDAARAKCSVVAGADLTARKSKPKSTGNGSAGSKACKNGRPKPLPLYKVARSASLFRRKATISRKGAGSLDTSALGAGCQAKPS